MCHLDTRESMYQRQDCSQQVIGMRPTPHNKYSQLRRWKNGKKLPPKHERVRSSSLGMDCTQLLPSSSFAWLYGDMLVSFQCIVFAPHSLSHFVIADFRCLMSPSSCSLALGDTHSQMSQFFFSFYFSSHPAPRLVVLQHSLHPFDFVPLLP